MLFGQLYLVWSDCYVPTPTKNSHSWRWSIPGLLFFLTTSGQVSRNVKKLAVLPQFREMSRTTHHGHLTTANFLSMEIMWKKQLAVNIYQVELSHVNFPMAIWPMAGWLCWVVPWQVGCGAMTAVRWLHQVGCSKMATICWLQPVVPFHNFRCTPSFCV